MAEPDDIQKNIEALGYSIELLEEQRKQLLGELYIKDKDNNKYYKKGTRRTANFFYDLGYLILNLKTPDKKDPRYYLARQIWSCYEVGLPFAKQIYNERKQKKNSKNNERFTYPTENLEVGEKTSLYNLCQTMAKLEWIQYDQTKTGLEIETTSKCPSDNYLNGGWVEVATRYLIHKTLQSFAEERNGSPYKIFWNVELRKIGSSNSGRDKELDVVVELNDRFYIFETKSGDCLTFPKLVDNARLFDTPKSRFILCCLQENWLPRHFEPYKLFKISELEVELEKMFSKDFADDSIITIKSQSEKAFD